MTRRAVVVGIDTYLDDAIPDLKGAVNDAKEIQETLTNAGEFEVMPQHFLLNDRATAENVRGAVSDLLWSTDPSDLSLLYFSGHGLVDSYGNGYVAPYDMFRQRPLVHGVRMQELQQLMLAATENKRTVLLLLDCCYSGIAADGAKGDADPDAKGIIDECLRPLENGGSGRVIFTSSPKNDKTREKSECRHRFRSDDPHDHGLFTFQLLEALDGGAASDDGNVTLDALIRYVTDGLVEHEEEAPRLYGSSVNALSHIRLGRAARRLDVEERIVELRQLLDGTKAIDLFRAIDKFEKLSASAPQLGDLVDLRSAIDGRLNYVAISASNLLLERGSEWSERCEETFRLLEEFACSELTCASVLTRDRPLRNLLCKLVEVSCGESSENVLKIHLLRFGQEAPARSGELRLGTAARSS